MLSLRLVDPMKTCVIVSMSRREETGTDLAEMGSVDAEAESVLFFVPSLFTLFRIVGRET